MGTEKVMMDKGTRRLPSWDKFRGQAIGNSPPDQAESMKKLALNFILRCYPHLSSFAAYHIEKYRLLKGALFIFSKVSFHDLRWASPGIVEQ